MPWLRNATLGTIVGPLMSDRPMYMYLRKQRDANQRPVWEDIGDQEAAGLLSSISANIADPSQAQSFAILVPALAAAAATTNFEMGNADRAGTVVRAAYIPNANVVGQATNSRTLNVINGGATGAATTNVGSLALGAGTNLTAAQENALGLGGTVAVNAGDAIQWQSALVGTGLADPGGLAVVTLALAG